MRHPHGETVTRVRAAVVSDPYSGEATGLDWDDTTELQIPRVAIDPSKTRETFDTNRNATVTDFVLWPDDIHDVISSDRIIVRGLTCNIIGRPVDWGPNPFTGDTPGMEIFCNVWEG